MVVQQNLQAVNNTLGVSQSLASTNTEKLVSGYRVNKDADTAAELQLSEKMKKQFSGVEQTELDSIIENIMAAESQPCDVEKAEEMVARANRNILQQADQSVLSQANQVNQEVYHLLQ